MFIDTIYAVILVMAAFKGYSKGLVVALFNVVAFVVGLAAAMKLSTVVAGVLKANTNVSSAWLPFLSFIIVFFLVVFLVKRAAKLVEKGFQVAWLGWANNIAGVLLYVCLYTIIFSIVLFYVQKINFLSASTITASKTYGFVQPWGPKAIDGLGVVVPWFRDMFVELTGFFDGVNKKLS